jgi:hypothetical protein
MSSNLHEIFIGSSSLRLLPTVFLITEVVMPADKSPSPPLAKLYAKAVTRSEKLEKTLAKIIARNEPRSDIEALLKDVHRGLKLLRKGATAPLPLVEGSDSVEGPVEVEERETVSGPAPGKQAAPRRAVASRKIAGTEAPKPRRTRAATKTS